MRRPRRIRADMDLDLTPVLSLVVHLLPMLLILVRFRQLAQIDVQGPVLPTLPAPDAAAYDRQSDRVVSVAIGAEGFVVGGLGDADPRIPCSGPCTPDTYDYVALRQALREAAALHPGEDRVVVAPAPAVPYSVVIDVMDAARGVEGPDARALFPRPILAAPVASGSEP